MKLDNYQRELQLDEDNIYFYGGRADVSSINRKTGALKIYNDVLLSGERRLSVSGLKIYDNKVLLLKLDRKKGTNIHDIRYPVIYSMPVSRINQDYKH